MLCRYMAAVHAAAAVAARDSGGGKGGVQSVPPSMQKAAAPAREQEKLLERLRGVCEGGSVIPVPFLRAAHAVPPAILDDMRAPYVHLSHAHAPLVSQLCWWTHFHHLLTATLAYRLMLSSRSKLGHQYLGCEGMGVGGG